MRKSFIVIICSLVSFISFSEIKKSSLAASSIIKCVEKAQLTAKDYVQNGLDAMWDGIENVGWGMHDENSQEWVDLVGGSPSLILNAQTHFSINALVRQGNDGRITGYPNIDWSNPLSERTLEFVMSAENLPESPTTTYYFFAMQVNAAANRIIWSGTNPSVGITLRAGGGVRNTNVSIGEMIYPNTFSLVGSSKSYLATRNYAYYFCNGDIMEGTSFFGGDPISAPRFNIFAEARAWPEENTIRIHCIRFYNRALSEEEIKHNRKIDELRFNL